MATTVNLGKVSVTPKGAYSPSATYSRLDIVSYAGSSFIVLQNVQGVTPAVGDYYALIASKGDKGDKGTTGDTGSPPTITSQVIEYQVGDTGTTVPTGAWSSSIVTVPQGKYLWCRTTITFQNSSPIVIYTTARAGVDGSGSPSDTAPLALASSASAGVSSSLSRGDHVHPLPEADDIPTDAVGVTVQDALDAKAVVATYTANITTTWTGANAPYSQTISVNGLTSTDTPVIDLIPSNTYSTAEQEISEWGYIYKAVTGTNQLTVYATDQTTTTLTIQIMCVR